MMWNEHRHTYDLDDIVHSDRFSQTGKVIALSTQPMILIELEDGSREWVSQGTVRTAIGWEVAAHHQMTSERKRREAEKLARDKPRRRLMRRLRGWGLGA